jgi:hypothetical protein
LSVISEAMATEEEDLTVDPSMLDRMRELREQAVPYLRGGT